MANFDKKTKTVIDGKVGFDKDRKPKAEIISKEETMFKVDKDGKVIPEEFPIYIYDRELDRELIEESFLLMESLKKQKSTSKIVNEMIIRDKNDIQQLQNKFDKETDQKKKKELELQLIKAKNTNLVEEIKSRINTDIVEESIIESRELIANLKKEKEKQTVEKSIELIPCTTSEAYMTFEKGKTIEGKDTTDWIADLISKRIVEPKYTLGEAKNLKPDFKIAIKEAIMRASNYSTKSYRDILIEKKFEEKPLTKKG